MIGSSEHNSESIIALKETLNGNLESLTGQDSEENISRNVVGVYAIISSDSSCINVRGGSGLMITTDGFVLTAYHTIQKQEENWRRINSEDPVMLENVASWVGRMRDRYCVMDQEGNRHPIDTTFWAVSPDRDIALIKAFTGRKPKAIKFKLAIDPLQVDDQIKLFALKDHILNNKSGQVICGDLDARIWNLYTGEVQSITYDTFLTDAIGIPGYSGGAFTDLYGRFAGLALYIQRESTIEIGKVGGAKVKNIIPLIEESANNLDTNQLTTKR